MPPAYDFLYENVNEKGRPLRFYVAKGGRGKGATWSIARRLIDKAHSVRSRILCTRSIQASIAESVHQVLAEQIEMLGYQEFFTVNNTRITSLISGSEFIFRGLSDLTANTIKSMEGVTDVWVAEAEDLGEKAWRTLRPTIRTPGSKIYVDYNPDDEGSPTNKMFTISPPRTAIVRHINFDQNPWFPEVLEEERQESLLMIENAPNEDAREQAQLDYNHVWLGATRKVNKASIFGARYRTEAFEPRTPEYTWDGPYDGADWGFSVDPTVRARVWIRTDKVPIYRKNDKGIEVPFYQSDLCIEREAYGNGVEINDLPELFDKFPDSRTTRIRGDNARPETISHMKNAGFNIIAADKWKGSVEDGVAHIKGYRYIVIHPRCTKTEEEARLYSFKLDRLTGEVTTDIVDAYNHCWDAIRYALDPVIQRKKGARFFS